jgi:calcineurin-like phosphoesterase family protein
MLGDVAFSEKWLEKVKNIKCKHKKLVCGNHDLDHFSMARLVSVYDSIDVLYSKRNVWWTHCPMHPDEIRRKFYNIHGHTHNHIILNSDGLPSEHYFNACVEHTDYKPITFGEIDEIMKARLNR